MPLARAIRNPLLILFLTSAARLCAALHVVAPDGDDAAVGSETAPWKTLSHAAATATAGDVVEVRGGVYVERVNFTRSGSADAPIVFRARAGETPVVDGGAFTVASGWYPLFRLTNVSHVTIRGFELRNLRTSAKNRVPIGILVSGAGTGVRLLGNRIHDLGTTYPGSSGGDAHGIAVYGDAAAPITDIVVRGNVLHDLSLGSSEALVLNGNVAGFLVEANEVRDCNNIGIDAIGHEGTCPDPAQDAARNGVIRANTVHGISSYGNPAYGNHYAAGGIYVDGGRDILVERNTVRECDIGIELASEHSGEATSGVTVRNNLVHRNRIGGLFMGGYDTRRGRTENCRVEHNTFFENDSLRYGNGEIHLQFDVRSTVLRHNILVANSQGLVVGNPYTQNTDVTLDHNVVHAPGAPRWLWKKTNYSGWSAWRAGSGQDEHSLFADPGLLDPMNGGFALRPRSPAIDAGVPAFVPAPGETDHAGRPRLRGVRVDIGALEFDLEEFSAGGEIEPTLLELSANEARLTLRRRADWAAWSLVYRIQTATTLAPSAWTDVASTPAGVEPIAPSNGAERAVFAFAAPGAPCWFARVKIDVGP